MSLINDALRRAMQARRAPTQPADGPALTPVNGPAPARWPVAAVPLLLMGVVLVAAWFLKEGLQPGPQSIESASSSGVAARQRPAEPGFRLLRSTDELRRAEPGLSDPRGPVAAATPSQAEPDPGSPVPSSPLAGGAGGALSLTNADSAGPTTAAVATLTMPAPTNPAPLKLKAIFYRPSDPWAMINSKLVRIGDRYGQARVVAITPDSVSLVSDGQTNVLTLEH